jgi:hypothetical protein
MALRLAFFGRSPWGKLVPECDRLSRLSEKAEKKVVPPQGSS